MKFAVLRIECRSGLPARSARILVREIGFERSLMGAVKCSYRDIAGCRCVAFRPSGARLQPTVITPFDY
jgi:hypothetical protein